MMSDNLKKKEPQDGNKVNVHEDWELRYWSQKFGVTPDELKKAVKEVGPEKSDVKKRLGK